MFDGSTPLIEGNTLSGAGPHIYGFGFGDGSLVRDNRIENPLVYGIIAFDHPSDVVIEGNTVIDPGQEGISIWNGTATVRRNDVRGAGLAGISVWAPGVSVIDNELTDNQTAIILDAREGILAQNVIRGGALGIIIGTTSTGDVRLSANDVEGASGQGLSLDGGSPVLRQNRFCGNGENLAIGPGASPDIDDSNEICEDAPVE